MELQHHNVNNSMNVKDSSLHCQCTLIKTKPKDTYQEFQSFLCIATQ